MHALLSHRRGAAIAFAVLLASGLLALTSLRGDSLIVDEVSHLPSGYTYVTRGDMRLNPEHPPLTKDLAGLAVLAWSGVSSTPVRVPTESLAWSTLVNGQWDFGPLFLFVANGHPREMLFWGRLPTLLIFLSFGWWLFAWVRRRWGQPTALLTLLLYAASPSVLAHARYITTDLAATAAAFISCATFASWLERPSRRRLLIAALWLGLALLTKFSLLVLLPVFALATIFWSVLSVDPRATTRQLAIGILRPFGLCLLVIAMAFTLVVLPVYVAHTWNEPTAKQVQDLDGLFTADQPRALSMLRWMAEKPVLRAVAHYLTGVLMVEQRATVGSTTFFQGDVFVGGRTAYFPTLYLLKEPLALHLLTLGALAVFLAKLFRRPHTPIEVRIRRFAPELVFAVFIIVFWAVSVTAKLNIGVRHVLPTYPFVFLLVSRGVVAGLDWFRGRSLRSWRLATVGVGALLGWHVVSVALIHPSYLAYFNALAGGPRGGVRTAVDSNLDWGQDLLRLSAFVRQRGIERINVDYFGKDQPTLVMPDVARIYHVEQGPVRGWLAVSLTYLASERGRATDTFPKGPNRYTWLDAYQPVAIIGHSIAVYNIP